MEYLSKFVETLEHKSVYVYGLGTSGLASVEALIASKANIIAWDDNEDQQKKAAKLGANIISHDHVNMNDIACVLLSPGIPLTHPLPHPVVDLAYKNDVEVIGDIEVLGRVLPKKIKTIGITGTNGKSTTTALLGHIFKKCKIPSLVAGNIGKPVLGLDIKDDLEVLILELSSYQIDLCPSFRPDIGILLNISPDHIDRHGSLAQYAAVKAKIFGHYTRPIISVDDDLSEEIFDVEMELGKAPVMMSVNSSMPFKIEEIETLQGKHNQQNALAAYYACQQYGLNHDDIIKAMASFPGLEHRQQLVRKIGKISFVNDSKATNADAAEKALSTYKNIYWIVGGQSKEGGLSGLEKYKDHIRKAYLIGEATKDFSEWMNEENIPFSVSGELDQAVESAYKDAKQDSDVSYVLLSPACASWDQFKSFEDRGNVFIKSVKALT